MRGWLLRLARRGVHSPESNGGRRLIWQSRAKSNDRSLTTGDLGPQLSFAVMRITLTIGDHHDQIALSTVQCERGSALREYYVPERITRIRLISLQEPLLKATT